MRVQAGFTLMELIVTLVILGILAVVALPRLGNENVFRERGFRDGLVSTLGHARRMAVSGRHFVCVNVDGGAGTVTLTRDATAPEAVVAVACNANLNLPSQQGGCAANQLCAPAGVVVNGGAVTNLVFDPLGRLVNANAPRIELGGAVNIAVTNQPPVVIDMATGYSR